MKVNSTPKRQNGQALQIIFRNILAGITQVAQDTDDESAYP
ncbi:MAG: hypothetical protein OEY91_10770 [Nitrospirota bacterium]|nr:hypothetical protein [Nitrospirota bacterium]